MCCSTEPFDPDRPRKMMVTSQEAISRGRIDEWTSLADEQAAQAACSCIPAQNIKKIAKPGLRHFVADMPESDQIMVVDDGIPIWVDDARDDLGRMKPAKVEGLGLRGMAHRKLPDEERSQMLEVQEDMKWAGVKRPQGSSQQERDDDSTSAPRSNTSKSEGFAN